MPVWRLGVRIDMPVHAEASEEFFITGYLDNPGETMTDVPVFFLLDVYGEYWFWPSWIHYRPDDPGSIDCMVMDVPTGTSAVEVMPAFPWPDNVEGNADGLYIYGAMLTPDASSILGEMAAVAFGYGPGN